jgi:hypothetical protein
MDTPTAKRNWLAAVTLAVLVSKKRVVLSSFPATARGEFRQRGFLAHRNSKKAILLRKWPRYVDTLGIACG